MQIRIMIADDHAIVREGLRKILEEQRDMIVVDEASEGHEAILKATTCNPDVVLMDISMPGLNGIEATHVISTQTPDIKVIMLSMHHTSEHVFRAVKAGALGYILKESAGAHVVAAIRSVVAGRRYFCDEVAPEALGLNFGPRSTPQSPVESLSPREREVLQLVVEGKTSAEIAKILVISPKSVETYRSRLMQKLGITNIPALVKFAIEHAITSN